MNYIILDMEWNQAFDKSQMVTEPILLRGEIIEIGAVKTDENFNAIDAFKAYVSPKYYRVMNRHVEKITGITRSKLSGTEKFPQVYERFREWCGEDFRFITWGFDDIPMLTDNLELHGLDSSWGKDYYNLQLIFKNQIDNSRLQWSLSDAMEKVGIPLLEDKTPDIELFSCPSLPESDVHAHDAMCDALFTYEVCRRLDMNAGVASYGDISMGLHSALGHKKFTCEKKPSVLKNIREITNAIPCPECEKNMVVSPWLSISLRHSSVAHCAEHGDFMVRVSAKNNTHAGWVVTRKITAAKQEDIAKYTEKYRSRVLSWNEKHCKMPPTITTVMFDLDGTLLPFEQDDFVRIYFSQLCKKLAPLGYEPDSTVKAIWAGTKAMVKNDGSRLNSEVFWETFRALNPGKPDAKPLCDEFYTHEFEKAKESLKFLPEYGSMIKRLKSLGLRVVLATNPIFPLDGVITRMKWVGLDPADFDLITHYDNSTFCKPNPRYFEEITKKLGVAPGECVMIGNSVSEDMVAASLGMEFFLADEFVENPENIDIMAFHKGSIEDAELFAVRNARLIGAKLPEYTKE
ncbi:MAG: HAD family hydrolase [Oscillospiraceae bacterium]